jgi:hypothetical protein
MKNKKMLKKLLKQSIKIHVELFNIRQELAKLKTSNTNPKVDSTQSSNIEYMNDQI